MGTDKKLSLVEHLAELRMRLFWCIGCFIVLFISGLWLVRPFFQFLTREFTHHLTVFGPHDILWLYVRLAALFAITFSLPIWVYHLWRFIGPAFSSASQHLVVYYMLASFVCFVLGLLFGYYIVLPALLQVLLSMASGMLMVQLTATAYLDFMMHLCVPMACLFELPVFVACLTEVGVVTPNSLRVMRRYALFMLLVIAVCLTPADFISDLMMFLPLWGLYEFSIIVSSIVVKRRERK